MVNLKLLFLFVLKILQIGFFIWQNYQLKFTYFEFGSSSQDPFSFCQIQLALDTVWTEPQLDKGALVWQWIPWSTLPGIPWCVPWQTPILWQLLPWNMLPGSPCVPPRQDVFCCSECPTHCTGNFIYVFPEMKQRCIFPVHPFMYLWAIFIFPGSVCLFGYSKIGRLILGIYKSLTDTWMWRLGDRKL